MNSTNEILDDLEARIVALEEQLLPNDGDDKKLLQVLTSVNETLTDFSSKRERFKQIFNRVPALTEYLKPGFIDTIALDKTCEKEIVVSAEKDLVLISKQFELIQSLSKNLNRKEICEVPSYQTRLNKLETIHHQQLNDLGSVSDELNGLLITYNELINGISESFVKWDWILSKLEETDN